jgi:hypothetical protein
MPPIDASPQGAEILHQATEPKYPEPKPGEESDEPVRGQPSANERETGNRPGLPEEPEHMAADDETDPANDGESDIAG